MFIFVKIKLLFYSFCGENPKTMNEIQKYALKFVEENWTNINFGRIDYTDKNELIRDIKKETYIASWVITEVSSWGINSDHSFLEKIQVEHEGDFLVIKIEGNYYRYNNKIYDFESVTPKTKEIIYFD